MIFRNKEGENALFEYLAMCPLLQDLVEVYLIFALNPAALIHSSSVQFATP